MWRNRREDSDHPDHEDKYAWFRLHLKLAPESWTGCAADRVACDAKHFDEFSNTGPGADVYANGKLILPEGPHPDDTFNYQQISRLYKLNIPTIETSLTLAIRTLYVPFGLKGYTNFFYNRTFRLGNPEDLERDTRTVVGANAV